MIEPIKITTSLIPVFIFLVALILLDSFKLTRPRSIVLVVISGCVAAALSFLLNNHLYELITVDPFLYTRYISPVIEELTKAVVIIYLLNSKRIGFLVDGAIYGFAAGAGFAFIENLYYLLTLESSNILLWIVRGFGTAVMHGCTTAIFSILAKTWIDRSFSNRYYLFLPGFFLAVVIHSFFNHFILPAVIITLMQLILVPAVLVLVYKKSEYFLREWLEIGLDVDVWLLEQIDAGQFSNTKPGNYLNTLKSKFPGTIIADMLCYLRIHLELAIRAKGFLIMKEAGFSISTDQDIEDKCKELLYLEKSLGRTGKLALSPILQSSVQELWQLHLVKN